MLSSIVLLLAACSIQSLPIPEPPPITSRPIAPKQQLLYLPERQQQQYSPQLPYDLSLLQPQFQIPGYNFGGNKEPFPRLQPQILLYPGHAGPGQSFLLQPGGSPPPGNFLVPQPGPNVILRDAPAPPRPLFVAGYPKPAHIPPIEKDAEEVPTNPDRIPPLNPKEGTPEKLETFDDDRRQGTEAEVLAEADRNPAFNPKTSLRPGQRFFILNGQPLFTNYPYNNQLYPATHPLKYAQVSPPYVQNVPNVLFRSGLDPVPNNHRLPETYPENLVLLNQPSGLQNEAFFRSNLQDVKEFKPQLDESFGLFHLNDAGDAENDAIVVDAKEQDETNTAPDEESDAEVVSVSSKPSEPTIAQAKPGAIALAGPGGVAAAAPRGTAFVGREGVAVSSPQATAVAGPSRDQVDEEKNKKPNKKKQ